MVSKPRIIATVIHMALLVNHPIDVAMRMPINRTKKTIKEIIILIAKENGCGRPR
jgi:hypothetical protein